MGNGKNEEQGNEFDGMRQLNFSVRLGKAIVTVDYANGEVFILRYRPGTPGGPCYEWRCNADGSIEQKNEEVASTSTPMMPPGLDKAFQYCKALEQWKAECPDVAQALSTAQLALSTLEHNHVTDYERQVTLKG